jgi:Family of unknown function (DUF6261)
MELVKLSTTSLHNLESGQFIVRYFSDFNSITISPSFDPEFQAIHQDLQQQSTTYNLALAQVAAQQESAMLLDLDQKRDKKITALRFAWNAYRSAENDTPQKNAYSLLKPLMNNYKNLAQENYEAESLGIDNFVAGLQSSQYAQAVQLLNMNEHINNLIVANDAFKNIFNQRSNVAISTVTYNTKALKNAILKTYKELVNYVFTMSKRRSTNNENYTTILGAINNGRTYYANIIANRNGTENSGS